MNESQVQGMSQDKWNAFIRTGIGQPVPVERAFTAYGDAVPVRLYSLQEHLEIIPLDVAVHHDLTVTIDDADVHLPAVQVYSTVEFRRTFVILLHETPPRFKRYDAYGAAMTPVDINYPGGVSLN